MKKRNVFKLVCLTILFHFIVLPAVSQQKITAETALKTYLKKDEISFHWALVDSFSKEDLTIYNLLFTSQEWQNINWTHQLTIVVPDHTDKEEALLFITGGRNQDGKPHWNAKKEDDDILGGLATIAAANEAIAALLRQTPNQPLFDSKVEDDLLSYTLHSFKKDRDFTWPLLFPMVKSATKAMDVIQEFTSDSLSKKVDKFVVSGASKRGWTTWLTGAVDNRVIAIAPMVIDILNMPVSLQYQIETWGDYSTQIQDYVNLGIPQSTNTPDGKEITTMIDPYSYRKDLTMPKMIIMGTNDDYWVVDNVKNYINNIPGTNMLHYIPNVGHNLGSGEQAMSALGAFFNNTVNNKTYPKSKWEISKNRKTVNVKIQATKDILEGVIVWSAESKDKDFRNERWTSKTLEVSKVSSIDVKKKLPKRGYKAFYVDLKYKNLASGSYTQSSRVFILSPKGLL